MNILFIGPYRDGTGWSEAAIRTILALQTTDVNLVVRPIRYNNHISPIPNKILELEQKEHLSSYDAIIQNCLPHNFEPVSGSKNIGMWWTETNSILPASWPQRINQMDLGLIFNNQMVKCAEKSGVKVPLKIIKIPHYDEEVYTKKYPRLDLPQIEDKFVFYTIGEFNKRKNFGHLLMAFHSEFDPHENVELLIKTDRDISEYINRVKQEMKMYSSLDYYKREILIHNRLTQEQICGIHQQCNCFIVTSYGEGLCLPAMDATCFRNPIITNNLPGVLEGILWGVSVYRIKNREEPCIAMPETFDELCSAHDTWNSPSIMETRKAMREAFKKGKIKGSPKFGNNFKQAGKIIMEAINA